ncbi:MAG TPA: inositol monophosphatase family protein [Anaerolineales bacterium]|nr:inositol monophosphatase family protein [Anaerolineales bacterium]
MEPTLADLESLARGAGEILRIGSKTGFRVSHKGVTDLVTELDYKSEQYLLDRIREKFPGHQIVTEESGQHDGDPSHQWLIDPLDGTTNFSHGVPIYAVSLGYLRDGVPQMGAVYDPNLDACFSAERGLGSWMNGKRLRVSEGAMLDQSLLVTGFPYDIRTNPANNLDHYAHFALRTHAVRRLGSAALDLCYVADGRFDGYWELSLSPWDLAAGALIVEEAGGIVTRLDGEADYLRPPYSVLAGNPVIHAQMLEYFQNTLGREHLH